MKKLGRFVCLKWGERKIMLPANYAPCCLYILRRLLVTKHSLVSGLLLLALIFALMSPLAVAAQTLLQVTLDSVEVQGFPVVQAQVSVYDNQGYVLTGITADHFSLFEDGVETAGLDVSQTFEHPLQIVLVIDESQSMGFGSAPTPIDSIKETASEFFAGLPAADLVGVVGFSDTTIVHQDLTGDRNAITVALNQLGAYSNAVLHDGIQQGLNILKNASASRPVIVVITDSVDSQGSRTKEMSAVIDAAVRGSAVVFPIGWGGAKEADLQKLADLTQGKLTFFKMQPGQYPGVQDFEAAFKTIQSELIGKRLQHKISFSSKVRADGNSHTLLVKVDSLNRQGEVTGSFIPAVRNVEIFLDNLQDNQDVGGFVTISPRVEAPADPVKLEILLDGQPLETINNPPYQFRWDSSQVSKEKHRITLKVTDALGHQGVKEISLNVKAPVEIKISSPRSGAQVTGETRIVMDVASATTLITKVVVQVSGSDPIELTSPPYEVVWNSFRLPAGVYDVTATVYGVENFSAQDSIRVEVSGGSTTTNGGGEWIVIAVAAAVVGVMIPIALRKRRQLRGRGNLVDGAGGNAYLIEQAGLNPQQNWTLPMDSEIRLGRKRDENDILLSGVSASRHQAIIRSQPEGYVVISIKAENPVLVNGQPVQEYLLKDGDLLQMGESIFEFHWKA